MEYDVKLEIELIKLGFKRRWLPDKSGFWLEYNFKHKDIKMQIYVEVDHKLLLVQIKTGDYMSGKLKLNQFYDPIAKYKLTLENVKELIKLMK